jgi:hypothetical protein
MHHRHRKERIRRLHDSSQHIIPRDKRSDHAEHPARSCQSHVRVSVRGVGRVEVCCAEEDECDPDHCEERAEGQGGLEGYEPEEEGEDEPGEDLRRSAFVWGNVGCGCWLLT